MTPWAQRGLERRGAIRGERRGVRRARRRRVEVADVAEVGEEAARVRVEVVVVGRVQVVEWWRRTGRRVVGVALKSLFLAFWVGLVLPILFGLVFELYIIMPLKTPRDQTRILFLLQDWALGAVYVKIMYTLALAGPETEFKRVLVEARQRGLQRMRVWRLASRVIFPVVFVCGLMIGAPIAVSTLLEFVLGEFGGMKSLPTNSFLFRYAFPILLGIGVAIEAWNGFVKMMRGWMEQVRDEQFLVGRKLHNLEGDDAGQEAGQEEREGQGGEEENAGDGDVGGEGEGEGVGLAAEQVEVW
ncbi:E3 ubiquitin-protein ligase march6 [Borealophlyctis nickersoniae]|nr:E3 ubiquitin-protein ligase march6 [Borealophlyctis nickersoniae]